MGEKKIDAGKNEGEKKPVDAGKKEDGSSTVVFKIDMHCEGCAKKLKKFVKRFPGVEGIKTDCDSNKLTVTGKVDPAKLRDSLADKTNKKVELLTPPPPKKDDASKKPDEKTPEKPKAAATPDKPKDTDKPKEAPAKDDKKPKEPAVVTVVFKTRLHCEGCIHKIHKMVKKYKDVQDVSIDGAKDLVTVKGTMDVKALLPYLKEKLRRDVEVVPAKKEEKKEEKKVEEKKGEESGDGGKKALVVDAPKMEINKMQYYGYPVGPSTSYWFGDGQMYDHNYSMSSGGYYGHAAALPSPVPVQGQNLGYAVEHYQAPPYAYNVQAPQMFSDENPNACSIM
uniref:HMA domain-containing protein n=1 Tax=Kalanchoe fedtschenkoi TaxID=63787 RepID=A0A7N0VKD0_KALFE